MGVALSKASSFFFIMWASYYLSASEFIAFSLNYTFYLLIIAVGTSGLFELLVAESSKGSEKKLTNSEVYLRFSYILPYLFLTALVFYYINPNAINLELIFTTFFCGVISSLTVNLATKERLLEKHTESQILLIKSSMFGYLFGIVLYLIFKSLLCVWVGILVGQVLAVSKNIVECIKYNQKIKKINNYKEKIQEISPYYIICVLTWLSGYGINFILFKILSGKDVAEYTKIITIVSLFQIVSISLNQVWVPIQIKINKNELLKLNSNRNYYISMAVMFGILSLLITSSLSSEAVRNLQINSLNINYDYIFLAASAYIFMIPSWNVQNYFFINKASMLFMNVNIFSSIFGILIWTILIIYLGELGVYIGIIIYNFLRAALLSFVAYKYWKVESYINFTTIIFGIVILIKNFLLN